MRHFRSNFAGFDVKNLSTKFLNLVLIRIFFHINGSFSSTEKDNNRLVQGQVIIAAEVEQNNRVPKVFPVLSFLYTSLRFHERK